MLLQHAWLATLEAARTGMGAIVEEEEEEEDSGAAAAPGLPAPELDENGERWVDKEVGLWVREQLARRAAGSLGKHGKPALHTVRLDEVPGSAEEPQVAA